MGIGVVMWLSSCIPGPVTTALPESAVPPALVNTPVQVRETFLPPATEPSAPEVPLAATPTLTPPPLDWQDWPVVPVHISQTTREIYQRGLALGNNPHAFSKVGDCETYTTWFLNDFDQGSQAYNLGPYSDLQPVIDHFSGSYERLSVATRQGFTSASLSTPLWADREKCENAESPLACELRLHRPAFAIVALGTNDANDPKRFEENYRKVVETLIAQGVVPILATKADNLEGDGSINATIVRLAHEYDLPLWNFWAALQDLPRQGLQEDGAHLTWYPNDFSNEWGMREASWPWRNLTALQVLQVVWQGVTQGERQ